MAAKNIDDIITQIKKIREDGNKKIEEKFIDGPFKNIVVNMIKEIDNYITEVNNTITVSALASNHQEKLSGLGKIQGAEAIALNVGYKYGKKDRNTLKYSGNRKNSENKALTEKLINKGEYLLLKFRSKLSGVIFEYESVIEIREGGNSTKELHRLTLEEAFGANNNFSGVQTLSASVFRDERGKRASDFLNSRRIASRKTRFNANEISKLGQIEKINDDIWNTIDLILSRAKGKLSGGKQGRIQEIYLTLQHQNLLKTGMDYQEIKDAMKIAGFYDKNRLNVAKLKENYENITGGDDSYYRNKKGEIVTVPGEDATIIQSQEKFGEAQSASLQNVVNNIMKLRFFLTDIQGNKDKIISMFTVEGDNITRLQEPINKAIQEKLNEALTSLVPKT